jgi:hypothetical protein
MREDINALFVSSAFLHAFSFQYQNFVGSAACIHRRRESSQATDHTRDAEKI